MSQVKNTELEGDVTIGRNFTAGGTSKFNGDATMKGDLRVEGWLEARNIRGALKGLFSSAERLKELYPNPRKGWWALVGRSVPADVYVCEHGKWEPTGESAGAEVLSVEDYRSRLDEHDNLLKSCATLDGKGKLSEREVPDYLAVSSDVRRSMTTGISVDRGHIFNNASSSSAMYDEIEGWDVLWINVEGVKEFELSGVNPRSFVYFSSHTPSVGSRLRVSNEGSVPEGAVVCLVNVLQSEQTPGYENSLDIARVMREDSDIASKEMLEMQAMALFKGVRIDRGHLYNSPGTENGAYIAIEGWDSVWVNVEHLERVGFKDIVVRTFVYFSSFYPSEESRLDHGANLGVVPEGAKLCIVNVKRSENRENYWSEMEFEGQVRVEHSALGLSDTRCSSQLAMSSLISRQMSKLDCGVRISGKGKNLLNPDFFLYGLGLSSGELVENDLGVFSNKLFFESGNTYCFSGFISSESPQNFSIAAFDSCDNYLGRLYLGSADIPQSALQQRILAYTHSGSSFDERAAYFRVLLTSSGSDLSLAQIETGSLASAFEPFVYGDVSRLTEERRLRVLHIGSSFGLDSYRYVPYIMRSVFPELDFTLGLGYIGGCHLGKHLACLRGASVKSPGGVVFEPENYTLYLNRNGGAWRSVIKSGPDIPDYEEWDIITFQHAGYEGALDWDIHWEPYLQDYIYELYKRLGHSVRLGILLTQGGYGEYDRTFMTQFEGVASNVKRAFEESGAAFVVNPGTALQNLRSTSLRDIGVGEYKGMTVDSIGHLQEGIGVLCNGYAVTMKLLEMLGESQRGVFGDEWRPNMSELTANKLPSLRSSADVLGISDRNCYLAQVAAIMALKNPFGVTDLSGIESRIG